MLKTIAFVIRLPPVTKKNSARILTNSRTGQRFVAPSEAFEQYQNDCGMLIPCKHTGINYPVNVKAIYYMATRRRVDISNLHSALHDVLVHYGVVKDDCASVIAATDGSRVRYDKDNPRTEVIITPMSEER